MAEVPPYNPIFTRFVPINEADGPSIPGLVAYGLYKVAKREWVLEFTNQNSREPTEDERRNYVATWTESRLAGLAKQAEGAMGEFAETIVVANAPAIREDALKGSIPRAIWTSMAASFFYTLLLIGVILVLRYAGVDLLSIASSSGSSTAAPSR